MQLESLVEENYVSGINWWNDLATKLLQPWMSSSFLGLLAINIPATTCISSIQSFTSQSSMPQLVVFKMHMATNLAMQIKADFMWFFLGPRGVQKALNSKAEIVLD